MLREFVTNLQTKERKWRKSFGKDITDPGERRRSWWHYQFLDHAILRHLWHNFAQIAPGVYRSNHPTHARLKRYADMGIRNILNLRGTPRSAHHLFEVESCAALGIAMTNVELHARKPASREHLMAVFDAFDTIPRPFLMHCKSGADRAGLASALYLLDQCGASIDEARMQLSWRYIHLRHTRTGVLDHLLDVYADRLKLGPISVRDWVATEYDPPAIAASFASLRGK